MLQYIYPYLILTGCTIGAVLLYLWRQSLTVNRLNLALIRLNEEHLHDAIKFLPAAWPLLSQTPLRGMSWRFDWFGVPVHGEIGVCHGAPQQHLVRGAEMQVEITLFCPRTMGEQSYFMQNMVATLLLLLHTDLLIKATSTHATFMQMARLNLFMQHDIKNIAQFVQLMSDQLEHMTPEQSELVLHNLRACVPLLRQRADRIVHTLTVGQEPEQPKVCLSLRNTAEKIAQLFPLSLQIDCPQDVQIWISARSVECALENILKNYHDFYQRQALAAPSIFTKITQLPDCVEMRLHAEQDAQNLPLERLFEPFWSSDPGGLGIGLYQAKQLLEASGGSLQARLNEQQYLEFVLRFPLPS